MLQCRGCKDREKHDKVRCRRCEERDKKKNEVRKEKDKTQNVGDRSEKKISNEHDESEDCKEIGVTENEQKVEERSSDRSEVVEKNVVILGRPDEDSSNNENIATCELDLSCKPRAENFDQCNPVVQFPWCLKPQCSSNLVPRAKNSHVWNQTYMMNIWAK